jgi:hypothetical protein
VTKPSWWITLSLPVMLSAPLLLEAQQPPRVTPIVKPGGDIPKSHVPSIATVMALIRPHSALEVAAPESPLVDGWIGDDWFHNGAFRQVMADYIFQQTGHQAIARAPSRGGYDDYYNFLRAGTSRDASERQQPDSRRLLLQQEIATGNVGVLADATVDTNGGAFLLDRNAPFVHLIAADGSIIRQFGAKGRGPGELTAPFRMGWRADTLWVADYAGGVVFFTKDGRAVRVAFQQPAFQNVHAVGLDDHIAMIRAMAAKYPWMDTSRVGVYGYSAGGQRRSSSAS